MLSARLARAGLRASAQQLSVPRTAVFNGLRTYATAQEVKPPVALFGVDGTYATALVCPPLPPNSPEKQPTRGEKPRLAQKPFPSPKPASTRLKNTPPNQQIRRQKIVAH